MNTAVSLLLVSTAMVGVLVESHIFFQFPGPRSCFYGGYWGPDGDGPWRREPCDRNPGRPTATLQAGSATCLSIHEFVAHPATYDLSLFYDASIGPGDALEDVQTAALGASVADPGPSGRTGYQRFMVDIPDDKTCEKCTIQVRQYAEDLNWYYYACVDVKIVSLFDTTTEIDSGLSPEQCVWEPATSRMRANILRSVLIGTALVLDALLVVAWIVWMYCFKGRQGSNESEEEGKDAEATSGEEKEQELDVGEHVVPSDEKGQSHTQKEGCCSAFLKRASEPKAKRIGIAILVWTIVSSIVVAIVMIGLKACWFGAE